ncbi:hypothetical protein CHCC20335_0779 [Bacillus paralicheniformis]|nr:hypothetical protein CHCC20335_0779 [Bacillus paralicheniformis]
MFSLFFHFPVLKTALNIQLKKAFRVWKAFFGAGGPFHFLLLL